MRISDLQSKNIVNLIDGKKMGNIIDINIDEVGKILEIIVEKPKFNFFNIINNKELIIKWDQIDKIGEEVIFVRVVN